MKLFLFLLLILSLIADLSAQMKSMSQEIHAMIQDRISSLQKIAHKPLKTKTSTTSNDQLKKKQIEGISNSTLRSCLVISYDFIGEPKRRTYNEQKKEAKDKRKKHKEAWKKHKNRYVKKKPKTIKTTGNNKAPKKGEVVDDYEYEYDDEL